LEFDDGGFLVNWSSYVSNSILSPKAWLRVQVTTLDGPAPPGTFFFTPWINGHPAAQPFDGSLTTCIEISTQYIKFARRTVGQPQPPDCSGSNEAGCVENDIGFTATCGPMVENCPVAVTGEFAGVGYLRFNAMAPIVLVHGINADASWFRTNGFTTPLDSAYAPYALADFDPNSIPASGTKLESVFPELANEFGVTKVHVVAHSKGGLWTRFVLKYGPVSTVSLPLMFQHLGFLSLITLDTPHNGSVLADIGVGTIEEASILAIQAGSTAQDALTIIRNLASGELIQIGDLTRAAVQNFNTQTGDPPDSFVDVDGTRYYTAYRSVGADADIGDEVNAFTSQREVDSADCAGMTFVFGAALPVSACNAMYTILGNDDNFYASSSQSRFPFDPNDLVVSTNSALAPQFPYVPGFAANQTSFFPIFVGLKKNHSTVGDSCVSGGGSGVGCITGAGVLGEIRQIQQQLP
jgi:pimeloyl-ACP methyl ester carboxylesterase